MSWATPPPGSRTVPAHGPAAGLLELAVDRHAEERRATGKTSRAELHQIGDCLRENLRRYDSVGLTDDGAFVLALPDISRRGLAGAAERLRRELGSSCGGHW